jgi:hypothetical protein
VPAHFFRFQNPLWGAPAPPRNVHLLVTRGNIVRGYFGALIIIISIVGVLVIAVFASVAVSVNRAARLNLPRPYPEPTFEGPESPALASRSSTNSKPGQGFGSSIGGMTGSAGRPGTGACCGAG